MRQDGQLHVSYASSCFSRRQWWRWGWWWCFDYGTQVGTTCCSKKIWFRHVLTTTKMSLRMFDGKGFFTALSWQHGRQAAVGWGWKGSNRQQMGNWTAVAIPTPPCGALKKIPASLKKMPSPKKKSQRFSLKKIPSTQFS